jgi:uncharacterized protein YbaR (Trm112 family)
MSSDKDSTSVRFVYCDTKKSFFSNYGLFIALVMPGSSIVVHPRTVVCLFDANLPRCLTFTETVCRYDREHSRLVSDEAGVAYPIRDGAPARFIGDGGLSPYMIVMCRRVCAGYQCRPLKVFRLCVYVGNVETLIRLCVRSDQ